MTLAVWLWAGATAAAVLDSLRFWPQAVRLVRSGDTAGLSSASGFVGAFGSLLWCIYALRADFTQLLLSNVSLAAGCLTIGLVAATSHRHRLAGLAAVTGLLAACTVLPLPALAVAVSTEAVAGNVPFAVAAVRSTAPSGVSRPTWWLSAASAGLWLALGLAEGDGPTVLWAVCTGLVSAVILARTTTAAPPDAAPRGGL